VVGHVNNARTSSGFATLSPTSWHQEHWLATLQINYDREIHPEDEVVVRVTPLDGQPGAFALSGKNLTQGTEAFTAAVRWKENPA
jgi:acyl-CoA thioesterase FadM